MLEDLKNNIERLIALYEGEKLKNSNLQQALLESQSTNESYRKQIADLERQVDNLKLSEAFVQAGGNTSYAKEKIDKLIREIDKCIALLEG